MGYGGFVPHEGMTDKEMKAKIQALDITLNEVIEENKIFKSLLKEHIKPKDLNKFEMDIHKDLIKRTKKAIK